jgi:hypothetical protein
MTQKIKCVTSIVFWVEEADSDGNTISINPTDTLKEARDYVTNGIETGMMEDATARFVIEKVRRVFRDDGKLLKQDYQEIEGVTVVRKGSEE